MIKPQGLGRLRSTIEHTDFVLVLKDGLQIYSEDTYEESAFEPALEALPWAEALAAELVGGQTGENFRSFLAKREISDDPIGDFVEDTKRGASLPEVTCWAELRSHLERRGADSQVVAAARLAWHEYEGWRELTW